MSKNGLAIQPKDVHSIKFTRYTRSAKLANLAYDLKNFTFFKEKEKEEEIEFNKTEKNKIKNLKSINITNSIKRYPSGLTLLFLNQGLVSTELLKLRSHLKFLGITLTHLPTRFWSNSFISNDSPTVKKNHKYVNFEITSQSLKKTEKKENEKEKEDTESEVKKKNLAAPYYEKISLFPFKKKIHGNILGLHIHSDFFSSSFSFPNSVRVKSQEELKINPLKNPIYLIYQFIQNNQIQENYIISNQDVIPFYAPSLLKKHKKENVIEETKDNLKLSLISWPWDILSSQIEQNELKKTQLIENSGLINKKEYASDEHHNLINPLILNAWLNNYANLQNVDDLKNKHINLLLSLIKTNRLIFVGLLNSNKESCLFFDNSDVKAIDSLNNNKFITKKTSFDVHVTNALLVFEPFLFSCFNKKFLFYF